jgi:hypothetical protein
VVILVILALVAILLIINAVLVWRSDKQLESRLAAIGAAGHPISIDDMAGEPLAPDENAATYLERARADVEAMEKELLPLYESDTYREGTLTDQEQQAIRAALDAYPKVIPLLRQAAGCERYVPLLDYTLEPPAFMEALLPTFNSHRGMARLLTARGRLLLAEGNREQAAENCVLLMRLCRHFRRQPMLVGYLVSIACDTIAIQTANQLLQSGPVSEQARQSLEDQLAGWDGEEAYRHCLTTERAYGIEAYHELPSRRNWLARYFWNRDQLAYLEMIDLHLALARRPYTEARSAPSVPTSLGPWGTLSQLILPGLQASRNAMERTRALVRSMRVLLALQNQRGPGGDSEPDLSALGLPTEVTTDPFTGQPLIVKRQPDGWLVYSVGENLQDDGGQLEQWKDVGVSP